MAIDPSTQLNTKTNSLSGSFPTIVFDIGGTHFRSACVWPDGTLSSLDISEAINFRTYPELSGAELREGMFDYIELHIRRLATNFGLAAGDVAVSFGGVMNADSGIVYGSGPLWGTSGVSFDLLAELRRRHPLFNWHVMNDVTAALHYHAYRLENLKSWNKLMVVTISTGIACRVYDRASKSVPTHPVYGIQGEIGHNEIAFVYNGKPIDLLCDCGTSNHLNAFCSGRGIDQVLRHLVDSGEIDSHSALYKTLTETHAPLSVGLSNAVALGDQEAQSILSAVTGPVASAVLNAITLDPGIDRVVLTGGVVRGFKGMYLDSLLHNLERTGIYIVSSQDPGYISSLLEEAQEDHNDGLRGAALAGSSSEGDRLRISEALNWTVDATIDSSYFIEERTGLFESNLSGEPLLRGVDSTAASLVIVDSRVMTLYGSRIKDFFDHAFHQYHVITCSGSERAKSTSTLTRLVKAFDELQIARRANPVIAIGGGALLDLVGFACSIYRRGIPYYRIPTTLIGIVDAGIGVKTGINFDKSKNKLGSYYGPKGVIIDLSFLATLPERHIVNGMAEILKMGLCKDVELFHLVESQGKDLVQNRIVNSIHGRKVVSLAISSMLEELIPNLWEHQLDRLVDFGHTFSPKIEMLTSSKLLHGEAVAIDMALCTVIAGLRGRLRVDERERILQTIEGIGLPIIDPICSTRSMGIALQETTIHRDGQQRVPLPTALGKCDFVNDITLEEIDRALDFLTRQRHA